MVTLLLAPTTLFADASLPPGSTAESWQARCVRAISAARDHLEHTGTHHLAHAPVEVSAPSGVRFQTTSRYGDVSVRVEVATTDDLPADRAWSEVLDETRTRRWFRSRANGMLGKVSIDERKAPGSSGGARLTGVLRAAVDRCLDDGDVSTRPSYTTRYRLTATVTSDGCLGRNGFPPQTIELDLANGKLLADVVNRLAKAREDANTLVADYRRNDLGGSPPEPMSEGWTLRGAPGGELDGVLVADFDDAPAIANPGPCRMKYAIRATPIVAPR